MTERVVDSGTSGERGGQDSGRGDGEQQGTTPAPATGPGPQQTSAGAVPESSAAAPEPAPQPPAAATVAAPQAAAATAPHPEAQPAPVTDVPFEVWASRLTGALPGALRRVPFTASMVLVTLVAGLVARTVWTPIWREAWFHQVAYGLPALREGKIWTLLTGWFFYLTPGQYLSGLIMFALVVGACEMRLGSRAVAIAAVTGEIGGILLASLLVWALSSTSWPWAVALTQVRDVG